MAFTLVAGGDVVPAGPVRRHDFATVTEVTRAADATFVNLETPLTEHEQPADKLVRFRADPALARDLAAWGVDVATVANNHALDQGTTGLSDTLAALTDAGVRPVGGGSCVAEALRPTFVERDGMRFAFLGLASTLPNGSAAGGMRPGVGPVRVLSRFLVDTVTIDEDPGMAPLVETTAMAEDVERATDAVSAAKEQADVVVVACHWGVPPALLAPCQDPLATYQRPLGHALVDAGADSVVGHHPHALHGVEWYRDRPVLYSLGNLLFHALGAAFPLGRAEPRYRLGDLHGELAHVGALARLRWDGPGAPTGVELLPVTLDEAGEPALAAPDTVGAAVERLRAHCDELGTSVETRDGVVAVWGRR